MALVRISSIAAIDPYDVSSIHLDHTGNVVVAMKGGGRTLRIEESLGVERHKMLSAWIEKINSLTAPKE